MKVFANKRTGGYSGGLIIVAANSVDEAHKAFHSCKELSYMWDDLSELGEYDETCVFDYYYYKTDWFEIPNLTANVDKPQVIIENGHSE